MNDSGPFGATLSATALTTPAHGALTLNPNGGFTYTPVTGYVGPDAFIYRASDGMNILGSAWVNLSVSPAGLTGIATNPPPFIKSVMYSRDGVVLTWAAVSGRTYRVEYNNDFNSTNWIVLSPDVTATDSTASTIDRTTTVLQRFYRVLLLR